MDAIIAGMQFRGTRPVVFDILADDNEKYPHLANLVKEGVMAEDGTIPKSNALQEVTTINHRTIELLGWTPRTSKHQGTRTLIDWHKRSRPLSSELSNICRPSDWECLRGETSLLCASDCDTNPICIPSIFDTIISLTRKLTHGCRAVLYTSALDDEAKDAPFETEYLKEEPGFPIICNIAFVSRESQLVKNLVADLSENTQNSNATERREAGTQNNEEFDAHNGRLEYNGWIIVWVPNGQLSHEEKSLLKISPRKFFSSSVHIAIYAADSLRILGDKTDNMLNAVFLVHQMSRKATKRHTLTRIGEDEKEHVIRFPAELERRVSLMTSEMVYSQPQMTLREATRIMRAEMGQTINGTTLLPECEKVKRQREFYSNVQTIINRPEFRSVHELKYHHEFKHWIGSNWIVHEMKHQESQQLRCEWLQEHVTWGGNIDQLSFARVMARQVLKRQVKLHEPDDLAKKSMEGGRTRTEVARLNIIESLIDWQDWHLVLKEKERTNLRTPGFTVEEFIDHLVRQRSQQLKGDDLRLRPGTYELFVRVLSKKWMDILKIIWDERKISLPPVQKEDFMRGETEIYHAKRLL